MENFLLADINVNLDFSKLPFFTRQSLASHLSEKFFFEKEIASNFKILIKYFRRRKQKKILSNIFEKYGNNGIRISKEKLLLVNELSKDQLYIEYEIDTVKKEIDIFFDFDVINFYKYMDSLTLTGLDYALLNLVLLPEEALLLHSSAVAIAGKGYLFLGHSTYGKSTIYNLIKEKIPEAIMFCDDRNIVVRRNNILFLTPFWREINDSSQFENKTFPISKIFFIEKAEENHMEKINTGMAKTKLFNFFFRPGGETEAFVEDTTKFLFDFTTFFDNFYILKFTKDEKFINYFNKEIANN